MQQHLEYDLVTSLLKFMQQTTSQKVTIMFTNTYGSSPTW